MTKSDRSKEWEVEFDKRLGNSFIEAVIMDCHKSDKDFYLEISKHTKSFIQKTLDSQRQLLIEKVEGLITEYTPDDYNVAIGDVINLLKEYETK